MGNNLEWLPPGMFTGSNVKFLYVKQVYILHIFVMFSLLLNSERVTVMYTF